MVPVAFHNRIFNFGVDDFFVYGSFLYIGVHAC